MRSDAYTWLSEHCGFMIFPSCAEGSAGAVLNSMARGIIPLATREAGVDLRRVGVELPDSRVETICRVAQEVSRWSDDRCREAAREAYGEATTRYTPARFGARVEDVLRELLAERRIN
jgi:hypothetical protein